MILRLWISHIGCVIASQMSLHCSASCCFLVGTSGFLRLTARIELARRRLSKNSRLMPSSPWKPSPLRSGLTMTSLTWSTSGRSFRRTSSLVDGSLPSSATEMGNSRNTRPARSEVSKIVKKTLSRQTTLPPRHQAFICSAKMPLPIPIHWDTQRIDLKTAFLEGRHTADRDLVSQLPLEAGKPWFLAARLKKASLWNERCTTEVVERLDAAVLICEGDQRLGLWTSQPEKRDV